MSFDLGAMLKDVSNLDTTREQIEYIRLDSIDSDPNNFYQINGIEELANNIATCGLQQPIRVRQNPDAPERYVTVSGHRRRAAIKLLAQDDPERWVEVPCIVERDTVSPALQQLRLIYANANTRTMTSAERGEQAAQVEKLLYQLKEEGYNFPGRMRDHVAEAVNASKTKLARLKVIREGLAECWMPYYKDNTIGESTAYELAHMPKDWQELVYTEKMAAKATLRYLYADDVKSIMKRFAEIDKLMCHKTGDVPCQNKHEMRRKSVSFERYYHCPCTDCCESCEKLSSCKMACPLLADKISQIKADNKTQKALDKLQIELKERPVIDYIRGIYERVGKARNACGASVEDLYKAQKRYYSKSDAKTQSDLELGKAKITTGTTLPFGFSFSYSDASRLCAVADLLGCSIDYLLGRAADCDPEPAPENVSNSDTWHTGTPATTGDYVVMVCYCDGCGVVSADLHWDGARWMEFGDLIPEEAEVLAWIPRPIRLLGKDA